MKRNQKEIKSLKKQIINLNAVIGLHAERIIDLGEIFAKDLHNDNVNVDNMITRRDVTGRLWTKIINIIQAPHTIDAIKNNYDSICKQYGFGKKLNRELDELLHGKNEIQLNHKQICEIVPSPEELNKWFKDNVDDSTTRYEMLIKYNSFIIDKLNKLYNL